MCLNYKYPNHTVELLASNKDCNICELSRIISVFFGQSPSFCLIKKKKKHQFLEKFGQFTCPHNWTVWQIVAVENLGLNERNNLKYYLCVALWWVIFVIKQLDRHSVERIPPPRPSSCLKFNKAAAKFHTVIAIRSLSGTDFFFIKVHELFPGKTK